jgi:glycogen operon protein
MSNCQSNAAEAAQNPPQGKSFPLGATFSGDGVNFSVYAKNCDSMELLLFDHVDDPRPARIILLDSQWNRTYHYWHTFVPGLGAGQLYAYRTVSTEAHRPVLLDPYGRAVVTPVGYDRRIAMLRDGATTAMKSVVTDRRGYDWQGDAPPRHPFNRTVIYELHVAGFTRHPSSGISAEKRGTYAGLIEKIPYLRELGVTAVELMPVFHFDSRDAQPGLVNYWGYSPVSFFAPHADYSSRKDPLGPLDEFRDMVKGFHRAGIEVILDVVFNHTAEGDQTGPTFCYRGLADDVYYIIDPGGAYADYTGCGNTLNANNSIVRRLILDSLRFWVEEMHVDGFRFDLASILSRDERGRPLENPPVLWDIESEPALAGTKLIAEAWDAAGLYQVGSFIGDSWNELNGSFRDDVRNFLRGGTGTVSRFVSRLLGSPDIYGHKDREPEQSINFVTCHDGFTLNDLVSYERKHNEANGEENRDGADTNLSWNCGVEGPTDDTAIETLRNRQVKNFLALTLIALGAPMLLMGDEARRTQGGNNNAYCQDNETSWFDWNLVERHTDIHRFVRILIAARLKWHAADRNADLTLNQILCQARLEWHGVRLGQPDWGHDSHSIAFTAWSRSGGIVFHFMINAYSEQLTFELPPPLGFSGSCWRRWFDTSHASPDDIVPWDEAKSLNGTTYDLPPYSLVALLARFDSSEDEDLIFKTL